MTEPPFGGADPGQPYPPPYPPGQAYPPPPPPPPPYPPSAYFDPAAPYGRDRMTGEPFSDKSKVAAGLLQLLGVVGILGIGRIYMGQTGFGIAQLLIGLFGGLVIGMLTCGVGLLIPVVWGIIDAILILTGRPRDAQGRLLRDGS